MNEEILLRNDATFADVDVKQRIIEVIAVPWEQQTQIMWRGELWNEVFSRGAFNGLEDHVTRIRVNREHTKGDTVGAVVQADTQDPRGLILRTKIAKTPRGDETLALAEENMISGSIGYFVKQPIEAEADKPKLRADVDLNKRIKLRRVNRAFLDHFSFVESPAYEGAQVLAVREDPSGLTVVETPLPATPNLDEFINDPVLGWALSRTSS